MQEWTVIVITGFISLVVSIVTSVITLKVTRNNDVKKHILEKRTEFYLDVFPLIDLIINEYDFVFDFDYMKEFIDSKSTMKLLASKKTHKEYNKLFQYLIHSYNQYCEFYNQYEDSDKRISKKEFEEKNNEYIKEHQLDRDYLDILVSNLYQEMRNDLGSNMK